MYEEYIKAFQTHKVLYGPKTAVFMMVGTFYELYDVQDRTTGLTVLNVKEVADILGIAVTPKKDLPATYTNSTGLFAGFPDYTLHKHAGRLTAIGWTVVVIDQVKDKDGRVLRRDVARILSPSTHVEAMSAVETPYVTVLVFKGPSSDARHPRRQLLPESKTREAGLQIGLATLDLTTGTTISYHGLAQGHPDIWTADDIQQQLALYVPKELWIYNNLFYDESFIRRQFSIPVSTPVHVRPIQPFLDNELLRQAYAIQSMLPIREYLCLRSDVEELALLHLIQFAKDHMPSAIKQFQRNSPWIPEQYLICGNHALQQLQMSAVVALFTTCITPIGKRALPLRLLKPLTQAALIRNRLDEVAAYQSWPTVHSNTLEKYLRYIGDLPRLHRKCQLGTLTSSDCVILGQSYAAVEDGLVLFERRKGDNVFKFFVCGQPANEEVGSKSSEELKVRVQTYRALWATHINGDKALLASEDVTPFSITQYPDIGALEKSLATILQLVENVRQSFCTALNLNSDAVKLEAREKEPFGLKASTTVLKAAQAGLRLLPMGTVIHALKSGGWMDTPELTSLNGRLLSLRGQLAVASRETMLKATQALSESLDIWTDMEEWVAHVDCTQAIARTSAERGFHPPTMDEEEGEAYVDVEGLRHPLVENTGTRVPYVSHHVKLDKDTKAWLVYGMNASGKSTLMKATGIAVLLAQAGCYVPAIRMKIRPFKSIYTRILNHDNLFAGLSSFAVEMSELRDILRQANQDSLVLGDELCSGTESLSAMSLVAAGIEWLADKRAKFIFATHLHDLPSILNCEALGLQVWHLHVEYDPVAQRLVYDRTLMPGNGSALYGLEVARAMDLPIAFLEKAHAHRKMLMGSQEKTSSWNSAIVRRACEICGSPRVLEVHHIQPRESAVKGLLPDGTPMNAASNLIVLCEVCHDRTHGDSGSTISSLVQTSTGVERIVKDEKQKPAIKKSKWSEEQRAAIESVLKEYKGASMKALSYKLMDEHQIDISSQSLAAIKRTL